MPTESMFKQVPSQMLEPKWYAEMANAFETYGIYFLVIFVFIVVVFITSHKYNKACTEAIKGDEKRLPQLLDRQRTWKWINYGAWLFGGILALMASMYWMYTDLNKSRQAPSSYSYLITFEGHVPNIRVDSTLYFKKETSRGSVGVVVPGMLIEPIYTSSFVIVKNEPFYEGERFAFDVIRPSIDQQHSIDRQTKDILFNATDCKGSLCLATYEVWENKLEKIAVHEAQNVDELLVAALHN